MQALNPYLGNLIDPTLQGVNRLLVLSFENNTGRTVHTGYYLLKVDIRGHNIMIDEQNFFDQSVKSNMRKYNDIQKTAADQGVITQLAV